ncbi:MAG TPA: hypothetical protein VEP50_09955 [bacterium]|nr:hypothetical protein [bacterium]
MKSEFVQVEGVPVHDVIAARRGAVEPLSAWYMRIAGVQGMFVDAGSGWMAGAADLCRNGFATGW